MYISQMQRSQDVVLEFAITELLLSPVRPLMAISLPTIIPSNSLHPTRTTNQPSTHLFTKQSPHNRSLTFSLNLYSTNRPSNISSPHQERLTVHAISGSSGIGSSVVSEDNTELLDRVKVFDLNGNAIAISDLWKNRKAVVAFARHFGCVLCRKRADYLAAKKDRMDASGVALVLIGPEVYADPSYSSYEALRFVSGVSTTFTPGAGLKIIQAYMEGYRQDWGLSFEKDTRTRGGWQQGGIIVAGPGKSNISYVHKDKEAGDDPDIESILKVCCS
ncbi:thioredoxin-like protein AAED1, chloroplastic isoform X2 [Cornus florida]|uniref:thioredoxin-like protein AAED1, chloroplastic isoform X2 n=1 Tax=Cornus florida TaxID=4283 RepID=UPI00289A2734|nr:thioredoxin-like protein AAED1, chloroplastic isoform X2 [Cornus florida]